MIHKYNVKKFIENHVTEIEGNRKYENHTINSPNPLARYAHRSRIKRCVEYIVPRLKIGNVLDYGCGTGVFISVLNNIKPNSAFGYEPFMIERFEKNIPIYSEYNDVLKFMPFSTVTIFEVIEHLSNDKLDEFLLRCDKLFHGNGATIIGSVPIEIGLGLILKEMHRILSSKKTEYKVLEFLKAVFWGVPGKRIGDGSCGYGSHKGFDFRKLLKYFESKGWRITILGYGPIPIKCWYLNSQVFFKAEKI
jgi:SAM-dependent methyltransferase